MSAAAPFLPLCSTQGKFHLLPVTTEIPTHHTNPRSAVQAQCFSRPQLFSACHSWHHSTRCRLQSGNFWCGGRGKVASGNEGARRGLGRDGGRCFTRALGEEGCAVRCKMEVTFGGRVWCARVVVL